MIQNILATILYPRPPIEVDSADYLEGILKAPLFPFEALFSALKSMFYVRYVGGSAEFSPNIVALLGLLLVFTVIALAARFIIRHELSKKALRNWFFGLVVVALVVNLGSSMVFYSGSGIEYILYLPYAFVFFVAVAVLIGGVISNMRGKGMQASYAALVGLGLLLVSLVAILTTPGHFEQYGSEQEIRTPTVTVPLD